MLWYDALCILTSTTMGISAGASRSRCAAQRTAMVYAAVASVVWRGYRLATGAEMHASPLWWNDLLAAVTIFAVVVLTGSSRDRCCGACVGCAMLAAWALHFGGHPVKSMAVQATAHAVGAAYLAALVVLACVSSEVEA